ncbi:hypothetical protein T10_11494 [Trichinella papuae]|uniref:Uncharacterized protein n=1 Tax=Trichinella papuae TaxID=268474 RepID=A0A0V1N9V6_9BILA|nr:hypothetical protein T10_11494 [Trichinella papuae]
MARICMKRSSFQVYIDKALFTHVYYLVPENNINAGSVNFILTALDNLQEKAYEDIFKQIVIENDESSKFVCVMICKRREKMKLLFNEADCENR